MNIKWSQLAGEWDTFTVVLRQAVPATIVAQRVLPWDARECTFSGLTPGRLYTITVTTNSGNLSNSVSVTARTSESLLFQHDHPSVRTSIIINSWLQ